MSIAILKRPRQLMLAAIMAIVLSASTLGAFGGANPAQAHWSGSGTGFCGTSAYLGFNYNGQYNAGPFHNSPPGFDRYDNYHKWKSGIIEFDQYCTSQWFEV
jgi:hypothetical protein